jgi:sulfate adenylyltransferase
VQSFAEVDGEASAPVKGGLKALAMALLTLNPTAAFQPPSVRGWTGTSGASIARSSNAISKVNAPLIASRQSTMTKMSMSDAVTGRRSGKGKPHGGNLVDLFVGDAEKREALVKECDAVLELSERQACDVTLLINGGFSPLTGFMSEKEYDGVVEDMRAGEGGFLFGLPVVLDVNDQSLKGKKVLLKYKGKDLAVLEAEEVWQPDKVKEAKAAYGTTSIEHPTVAELSTELGKFYAGGKIHGLVSGFEDVWGKGFKTPAEIRATLPEGKNVVAFQNRNPVHKAHFELLMAAKNDVEDSIVFVNPTCGPTQKGDIDGATRIKTYEVLQEEPTYKKWAGDAFRWSYLPYSMKMAGPREAIQHMIIRKNFGATHFIIGRDMAGTKSTLDGEDFYGAYDSQDIGKKHSEELDVTVVDYPNMVYVGEENGNERGYATEPDAKERGLEVEKLSGTAFRNRLRSGEEIPEWFAFPKVVDTLRAGGDKIFID